MSEYSIRLQTYIVCGVMIGCFSILYPKIFHPMLMRSLGIIKPVPSEQEHAVPHRYGPYGPDRPRPSIRSGDSEPATTGKRGGILSLVLPVYGVGIVIYLFYTLSKLYKSRKRRDDKHKDEYLKHYYRDFRFDVDRGEFRMGRDSSDDEETSPLGFNISSATKKDAKESKKKFTNSAGQFDWAAAYGTDAHPDIYRSAKSLPRDLEELLYRMENQEVVDNEELSNLRVRLEKTEREMMRLLHAMDEAEHLVAQSTADEVDGPSYFDPADHDDWHGVEDLQNQEADESGTMTGFEDAEETENAQGSEYKSDPETTTPADTEVRQRGKNE